MPKSPLLWEKVAWKFIKASGGSFIGQWSILIASGASIFNFPIFIQTLEMAAIAGFIYAGNNYIKHR